MWKQRAVTLCGALAMLPLIIGCSNGAGGPPQAYAPQSYPPQAYAPLQPYVSQVYAPPPMTPAPADVNGARAYAIGSGAPAAILVMLPGPSDVITANPQLWTAQGFDVVTPTPSELYRFAAEQERVAARLIAQAEALADAPIWVVGPNPAIEAAMASLPAGASGQVSGVVVISTSWGARTCSERMIYSYSGNGAPQVSVSKSGNACSAGAPFGDGTNSTVTPHRTAGTAACTAADRSFRPGLGRFSGRTTGGGAADCRSDQIGTAQLILVGESTPDDVAPGSFAAVGRVLHQ